MSNYKPQKGDRVRVTTEVEVIDDRVTSVATEPNGLRVRGYRALYKGIGVVIPADSCIEKVEPPVEVFKPGDVVRAKWNDSFLYSLGRDGYFSHSSALWFPYENSITQEKDFTSRVYERVELA